MTRLMGRRTFPSPGTLSALDIELFLSDFDGLVNVVLHVAQRPKKVALMLYSPYLTIMATILPCAPGDHDVRNG